MSLSQKHSGKVLVPWFSIAEWKAVYHLIYSRDKQNWPKALEILKIWKIRTPLLSAGVEGTLIVLEALLVDVNSLSSYEITHIFATSIIRFLNLCAASSDKQGNFYKEAMRNGLPKWLISLRHEIAHSHNVPSQSMLEISLQFCLEWLKEKYWDVQEDCMNDFIVKEETEAIVEDAVYIYLHLNELEVKTGGRNKKLRFCIKKYIKRSNNGTQVSSDKVVDFILNLLANAVKSRPQEAIQKISDSIVDNCKIIPSQLEYCDGKQRIPEDFLIKWNKLLNLLNQTETIKHFVLKLFNLVCDDSRKLFDREVASLWILEIFQALLSKEKRLQGVGRLQFSSSSSCMKDEQFAAGILDNPTPFTLNFAEEVLQYNNAPAQFVEDSINLLKAYNMTENGQTNGILTVEDLGIDLGNISDVESFNKTIISPAQRWIIIKDTTIYENLPLGVLPYQKCIINPVLDL